MKILLLSILVLCSCVRPTDSLSKQAPDYSETSGGVEVMIYSGPGSWKAEVASIKRILFENNVSYAVLNADELNRLSLKDLSQFRALVFAGGYAPAVRNALNPQTRHNIREAIRKGGVHYLGFCAGAWLAVAPPPKPGEDVDYGLGILEGPILEKNFLGRQGIDHAIDEAIFPDGTKRKLLWYGGPIVIEEPGTVVARYSDGTPAISQKFAGRALVTISGLHPTATFSILRYLKLDEPEAVAPDFAWALLRSTLRGEKLPTF